MGWLDRIKDAISTVLRSTAERIRPTREDREQERREREAIEEYREERITLTVYPMEMRELRPFSSIIQYSERIKVRRDLKTGKFVSKVDYKARLGIWRQELAGQYIQLNHPLWTERELALAVMRLEEIRAKPETSWMDDIELGELFTP